MAENLDAAGGEREVARVLGKLGQNRWTIAAAWFALAAVGLTTGAHPLLVLTSGFAVTLVAVLAPGRTAAMREVGSEPDPANPGLGGLTATDIAAALNEPLIVIDGQGTVLHTNDAARRAFGPLSAGTSIQLRFRAPEMQELTQRLLFEQAESATVDYPERVPVERLYRVYARKAGPSQLYVLVFKDQSELRRIDRMRADFIANASHELRTPLASIAGFIETLRGPAKNDAQARENFLQIMQNQTSRMARLIDDLLSLSRLEMKAYPDPAGKVDVRAIVESVIDTMSHLAAESGVAIERHFAIERAIVTGSQDELFQVFENLLENACKYGASGKRVIVSIDELADEEIAVTVRDFGPGIPEEHIPRVTERFYRVDVETSRAQKGTGLGLSIVKHILTRHKARLSIQSEVGKGAAFTVIFPAA